MLFFSRGASVKTEHSKGHKIPNLAAIIPAMDHIDRVLATNAIENHSSLAVQVVLSISKKTLNHYYSKTDLSNIYQITMGKYYHLFPYLFAKLSLPVFHPCHKLDYFKRANWQQDWINIAKAIVQNKYKHTYKVTEGDVKAEENDKVNGILISKSFHVSDHFVDVDV
jgi:hypothetical protein